MFVDDGKGVIMKEFIATSFFLAALLPSTPTFGMEHIDKQICNAVLQAGRVQVTQYRRDPDSGELIPIPENDNPIDDPFHDPFERRSPSGERRVPGRDAPEIDNLPHGPIRPEVGEILITDLPTTTVIEVDI